MFQHGLELSMTKVANRELILNAPIGFARIAAENPLDVSGVFDSKPASISDKLKLGWQDKRIRALMLGIGTVGAASLGGMAFQDKRRLLDNPGELASAGGATLGAGMVLGHHEAGQAIKDMPGMAAKARHIGGKALKGLGAAGLAAGAGLGIYNHFKK